MNLPKPFEEKMRALLKTDYEKYLKCFEEERHYGLRVNTNKISVEEFLKIAPWSLEPIPWIQNGFYYDGDVIQPAKHPYYFAGLYYLQEPSAMTPADRLPVVPGEKVLDLCAAPGGKATELGAKLKGEGLLAANDISASRAKGLLKNLELFGIGNLLVLNEEPGKLSGVFENFFDKILIDAPCSGEGMFRKDKKMIKAWEEHGPAYFSKIQRSIIVQAASMLKPGGMMLYSTCTFDQSENEQVISWLLEQCPEFEICEMEGYEGFSHGIGNGVQAENADLEKTVRIFPHRMKGEGHFLALLKKNGEIPEKEAPGKARAFESRMPVELEEFLQSIKRPFDRTRLEIHGERVYYMPEGIPQKKKLRFLRTGLLLGELKKNRFEPSQALAMYLKREEYPYILNFPCEDERVVKYLKGETLEVSDLVSDTEKGWYLVCVDGYSLGFGKLLNGMLKNKYLPGWRWQSVR
ncbi:RsmF rRNA methyltransferase first C-terminal domain-containing protein [Mediterraneibacter sp. NSJ-55]|uniref:RsmF rRNA methyltransferase first C-terminal domain-containing protein n=1 Tax=Mediterraneibacter hominis TaxID=2763054 RepID=A0A923LGF5_9FIRM|nr:RsmB/NOP family class I SAM-dependent RNA methyltransferase [Mediterraneibacter hominis]MBC5687848.1 RsmF rRNA methyltransferase first C-terminal domain-containing protein [Mediterraneibacter hominis]